MVAAAVSITVASRGASPISDMTIGSVEALTFDESSAEYAPTTYTVTCYSEKIVYDSWGHMISTEYRTWKGEITVCHSGHRSCFPLRLC